MSSTNEDVELKGGHAPALKVGGVRVVNRTRRDSEEAAKVSKEGKKAEEIPDTTFSTFKPNVHITGIPPKTDQVPVKEAALEEIRQAHEKLLPTHQHVHSTKPNIIQQPRK